MNACDEFLWRCSAATLLCGEPSVPVESPLFQGGPDLTDTQWIFSFYPKGDETQDHVSLFIKRAEEDQGPVCFHARYILCIVDAYGGDMWPSGVCTHSFFKGTAHGVRRMILRKDLLKDAFHLMPGHEITFKCYIKRCLSVKKQPNHSIMRTRIGVEKVDCTWSIENFAEVSEEKKAHITLATNFLHDFCKISCYPAPKKLKFEIQLSSQSSNRPKPYVRLRIAVLDRTLKIKAGDESGHAFNKVGEKWTFPDVNVDQNLLVDDFLVEGALTLRLELRVSEGEKHSFCEATLTPMNEKPDGGVTLKEDLRKQATFVLFPDIRIQVEGENFFAHMSLLAARSSVLREILEKMVKDKDSKVEAGELKESVKADKEVAVPPASTGGQGVDEKGSKEKVIVEEETAKEESGERNEDVEASIETGDPPTTSSGEVNEKGSEENMIVEEETAKESGKLKESEDASIETVDPPTTSSDEVDNKKGSEDPPMFVEAVKEESSEHKEGVDASLETIDPPASTSGKGEDKEGSEENMIVEDVKEHSEERKGSVEASKEVVVPPTTSSVEVDKKGSEEKMIVDDETAKEQREGNPWGGNVEGAKMETSEELSIGAELEITSSSEKSDEAKVDEEKERVLVIEDMDKDTFQRVLMFLYTDQVEKLDFEAGYKLYSAAVKYEIPLLKSICLDRMKSDLKQDNVIRALVLAEKIGDTNLRKAVTKFIFGHREVREYDDWKTVNEELREIPLPVMERFFISKKSGDVEYWSCLKTAVKTGCGDKITEDET